MSITMIVRREQLPAWWARWLPASAKQSRGNEIYARKPRIESRLRTCFPVVFNNTVDVKNDST